MAWPIVWPSPGNVSGPGSLDEAASRKFEDFADNVHDRYFNYSKEELARYKRMK